MGPQDSISRLQVVQLERWRPQNFLRSPQFLQKVCNKYSWARFNWARFIVPGCWYSVSDTHCKEPVMGVHIGFQKHISSRNSASNLLICYANWVRYTPSAQGVDVQSFLVDFQPWLHEFIMYKIAANFFISLNNVFLLGKSTQSMALSEGLNKDLLEQH